MFALTIPMAATSVSACEKDSPLLAGKNLDIGDVTVYIHHTQGQYIGVYGPYIDVVYEITEDGWYILETHMAITTLDPSEKQNYANPEMKQTKKGNPIPGQFPYKHDFSISEHVTMDTFTLKVGDIDAEPGDTLYVAAHASVVHVSGCGAIDRCETAWADSGVSFNGANWAYYFSIEYAV